MSTPASGWSTPQSLRPSLRVPPSYAIETFPYDAFSSENPQVFSAKASPSTLATYVSESSTTFGDASNVPRDRTSIYNAVLAVACVHDSRQ